MITEKREKKKRKEKTKTTIREYARKTQTYIVYGCIPKVPWCIERDIVNVILHKAT